MFPTPRAADIRALQKGAAGGRPPPPRLRALPAPASASELALAHERRRAKPVLAPQVRAEGGRDLDRSLGGLPGLYHRDHEAREGRPGTVQRVHELGPVGLLRAIPDPGAGRLEVLEVRHRADLEP